MTENKSPLYIIDIAVLLLSILLCGFLSLSFGKELPWDLAGYHFYNPYAYLHHRMNKMDYWPPSAIQVYITPTLDFISYYLINHCSPRVTEFILGAVHGINIVLIFYLSKFMLKFFVKDIYLQIGLAIACACLGIYAPTVYSGIGAFFNDNTISIFTLSFLLGWAFIINRYYENGSYSKTHIIIATIFLGMAAGFKLTFIIYLVGLFGSLIFLPMRMSDKLLFFLYSTFGIVVGFLITDGYWMWLLWQEYRNPFFPLFNGIFQSPFFPAINWSEPRFVPKGIIEALLFPFYIATGSKPTSDGWFTDYRFAIVYVLFMLFVAAIIDKKKFALIKCYPVWNLYLFFIFTYIFWQEYFSVMRYLNVLQMLSPLLCVMLLFQIFNRFSVRILSILAVFIFIAKTMQPMGMERAEQFGTDYFNVKLPSMVDKQTNATVLIAYAFFAKPFGPCPNHYLIPYFPANWHFSGIPFYRHHYVVPQEVRSFVQRGPKQVYLLSSASFMPVMYKAAKEMHLNPNGPCGEIKSDRQQLTNERILLCPVIG